MGSQAQACVAATALATRGGRTDVDHLVLMEAFAENGSSDVVAGAHRGGSVLRWQALSEAGDGVTQLGEGKVRLSRKEEFYAQEWCR